MVRGLYTAASGMLARDGQINVIANNLANVNTTGFKRDETIFREFPKYLQQRLNDDVMLTDKGLIDFMPPVGLLGTGVTVDEIFTEFQQGDLYETGNKCDAALWGDGFFAIQTPTGERYTRNGNFTLNQNGELVTMQGYKVLDINNQPINVAYQDFTITPDGSVYIRQDTANTYLTKLKIVQFENKRALKKIGENFYEPTEYSGAMSLSPKDVEVRQSYVEKANVNIVKEMVLMIEVNRAYELNHRLIRNYDELAGKAVNEVGRL
ncbi:MAG TPA: flagellar basal-body rod protein FlgF [bacterium]|nr:flagellar basal-body rod protein FlgF [bacterium]HOL48301.1 flagellar basal-body rod protein FlgF [bacterium]HPQ19801.1 flagellar basal-body rod protein FlgF [bacterium]